MAHSEELLDAPDGSALNWILDHCLRYPGTYEIPLRTMYGLNCNSMRQQGATTPRSSQSSKSSQSSHDLPLDPAADFKAQLTNQISRLPSQPCSLPPSFITTFLRRCFAPRFEDVDFHQALTALDYLRDLETRRRREMASAVQRLGLHVDDLKNPDLEKKHTSLMPWVESIKAKVDKIESLYSHVYIGLRRWTLISEMLVEPYNKANCIAMLNTLFPPVTEFTTAATPQLTLRIMKSQRDGFFRYISAIETNGKRILEQMIQHGAQPGDNNGWPLVRDALDKYLRAVNEIIDDCAMANGLGPSSVDEQRKGHNRKADSGVSFGSTQTTGTHNSSDSVLEKPLPPSPAKEPQARSGSTLERLARELRKIGDSGKSKNLKKMKSHSALASRTGSLSNQSLESVFDVDEQKRRRLIWEANNRKKTHSKQPSSDSR